MNRLVIVGNGFDLAHGLPTGYCDFIDWYWREKISRSSFLQGVDREGVDNDGITTFHWLSDLDTYERGKFRQKFNQLKSYQELKDSTGDPEDFNDDKTFIRNASGNTILNSAISFNNNFFQFINDKKEVQNWVDIENEYYRLLKECLKDENNVKVKKLNQEFEQVKKLLQDYLRNGVCEKFDFEKVENISEILKHLIVRPKNLINDEENNYLKEFPKKHHNRLIKYDTELLHENKLHKLQHYINDNGFEKNLFLNFNYTPTISKYISVIQNAGRQTVFGETLEIQIHGKLGDFANQINFGFGDEMDDAYKTIENKDDNEYLKNIKSFQYFQNSNYKDMLDFIDTDEFQVYVMGHSCGLSDRILLNKVFEHKNCLSIKVFYYKNGERDDFTEIVQNISRHFNQKEMMREKIVNKSLCTPLQQNIRFAKKQ